MSCNSFCFKPRHIVIVVALIAFSLTSNQLFATTITLSDGTSDFAAELRTGSSDIGVIMFHGKGQNPTTGDVVRQLGKSLNDRGHTTLSLANPIPSNSLTDFQSYANDEDYIDNLVFARLAVALNTLKAQGLSRIILSGFSLGSRFATASAAAIEDGQFDISSYGMDLVGLVGVGMYSTLTGSSPTASNVASLGDINVLDTMNNLALLNSIRVLDIFGSNDIQAATTASQRVAAFGGDASNYQQASLDCPPDNGNYYARNQGVYQAYYLNGDNRCHQLRNGFVYNATYIKDPRYVLRGNLTAPLEATVGDFFSRNFETAQVPEPETLWLMLIGLPLVVRLHKCRA